MTADYNSHEWMDSIRYDNSRFARRKRAQAAAQTKGAELWELLAKYEPLIYQDIDTAMRALEVIRKERYYFAADVYTWGAYLKLRGIRNYYAARRKYNDILGAWDNKKERKKRH